MLESEKLDASETATVEDCELEKDGELVTDGLAPTVSDDVGVIESDEVRLEVEEDVIEGVGVDEPVPETVAVMLSEAELVTEPVPVELGVMDADAPRVREGVCVLEFDALSEDVEDDVGDGVGVLEVVPEPVAD